MRALLIFLSIFATSKAAFPESIFSIDNSIDRSSPARVHTENKQFKVPEPRFRLPESFIPYHYEIRVRPILESIAGDSPQWTAPGEVTIYGTVSLASNNITLHSNVAVNESSVKVINLATLDEVPIIGHSYDTEKTFYIIELGQALGLGLQYSIYVEYVAEVYLDNLEGLYRNHYDDPITGETKYSIATQLQAFGARKVFPCLDEPAMKATFDITLGRRDNYSTLCNSPLLTSTPISGMDGWFWDTFNTTVKMPTYLVAIIIGDFAYEEANPEIFHKPVRTYGPKYLIDSGYGIEAAKIAAKVLYFFEEFFDVEYAMAKMDSIGIIDFPAGAMENYGLNIYGQNYLLYAPNQNDERSRRGVALTLNHELAHQWSGNLITCDWWTQAWLNEGFATYLSYQGMGYTNPEYQGQKAIQYDCVQNAFRNDVLENIHPTVLPDKGNPWDTMTYNANLVYSKGAALLRMMEGFLTLETLQKGLQTYMKAYSFQAANQDQFFQIITSQANTDNRLPVGATIKGIMDTWTLQKGFPKVKVSLNGDILTFTQEEYMPGNETLIYYIPISLATQSKPNLDSTLPQYWLFQQPNGVQVLINDTEWVVINSGGTGYYRVEYDDVLTERLQDQLISNHEMITLGSRSQFMDDYFTFAFDGKMGIEKALRFTKYLNKEFEFSVWSAFTYHMNKPRRLILNQPNAQAFKSYLLEKVSGALTGLIESGADLTLGAANLFYVQLFDWATPNNEHVTKISLDYYEQWKLNSTVNPIPPLLMSSVHCAAIRGSEENFMFALDQFSDETSSSRTTIIQGLACRSDPSSLEILLGVVTGDTTQIPKEYSQSVLSSAAAVHDNFGNMIPFFINNFDRIVAYQGSPRMIANAISSLSNSHASSNELSIIKSFIQINQNKFTDPEDIRILETSVAILESNIQWMENFGNSMIAWFNDNQ